MNTSAESAHESVSGVTPGMRRLAHVVAALTIPSGLWRVALVIGLPVAHTDIPIPLMERIHIVALSLVAEALALLSLGLVQRWGEVVPPWFPIIGGRPIHRLAATIPAASGAIALTGVWTFATVNLLTGTVGGGLDVLFPTITQKMILVICYAPLLVWGPLLGVLTVAYFRRRAPVAVTV